jgi:hypothetical protein
MAPLRWVVIHNLAKEIAVFGSMDVSISRNPETRAIRKSQLRCRSGGLRLWNRPKYLIYARTKRLETVYFGSSSARPVCICFYYSEIRYICDFTVVKPAQIEYSHIYA